MSDLTIVGLGISSIEQLTFEADHALRNAKEVLYLDTGVATRRFFESKAQPTRALYLERYGVGRHRLDVYQSLAVDVIEAALDHPPIAFAIHGHPTVGVYAPQLVAEMAKALGLSMKVIPGISAIDTVCAEVMLDPLQGGLQIYEATDLLLRCRPLANDVPALVWQIGSLESRLHSTRRSKPARFDRFVQYLLQFYPAAHEVHAIYCSPHPLLPARVLSFAVDQMPGYADQLHAGFSLFIPAASARAVQDGDLLRLIDSAEHLDEITEA